MKYSYYFDYEFQFLLLSIMLLCSFFLASCSEQESGNKMSSKSKPALIDYTKNRELYDKTMRAQILLDEYFGDNNNFTLADRLLNEVVQADENYVPAYLQKARFTIMTSCLSDCDSEKDAVEIIDKALAIDPTYADSYVLAGHVYSIIGNYNKARAYLYRAKQMGTTNPWLYYNFGYIYYDQRDYKNADRYFEMVVNNGPGNTSQQLRAYITALQMQQEIAYQTSLSDRLLSLAKKAVDAAHPKDAWTRGNAANLLCREGFFDEGIAYTKLALSIMQYRQAYKYLSFCYYGKWAQLTKEGKSTEAEIYFNDAYQLDPNIKRIAEDFSGSGQILRELRHIFDKRIETMMSSSQSTPMEIEL